MPAQNVFGDTSFPGGRMTTEVSGGQSMNPNIAFHPQTLLSMDDMKRLLAQRHSQMQQQQALMRPQYAEPEPQERPAAQASAAAPQADKPYYVKMVQGPGVIPGYINVPAGTPGAVVGGFLPAGTPDPGAKPENAGFSAAGAQGDAIREASNSVDFDAWRKSTERPVGPVTTGTSKAEDFMAAQQQNALKPKPFNLGGPNIGQYSK